jgi:hypothetical protein
MDPQRDFPIPTCIGGRLFFDRYDVENYKRALMRLAPLVRDPSKSMLFATAKQVCDELQIGRRTLGRRVRGRVRGE